MIWQITKFELLYRSKRPATYIYFFIFFAICFLIYALPESTIAGGGDKLNKNSPFLINMLILAIMMYGSIVCAAIMGVPVYRDYENNFHEIMFTLPAKRWEYLWGRFTGSFITVVFVFSGITLGILLGSIVPWRDATEFGPFLLESFIRPMFIFVIPNLLVLGAIFFALGSTFRSQSIIYAQGVVFLSLYFGFDIIFQDIDTNPIYSVFEPFGFAAVDYASKYWTAFEKNTLQIPFTGLVLMNRLFWIGIATIVSVVFTFRFKAIKTSRVTKRLELNPDDSKLSETSNSQPVIIENLTLKACMVQWWHLTKFYLLGIIKSIPFIVMIACGIGFFALARFGSQYMGTPSLPVTYMLLDILTGGFSLFLLIIIIVYSGELIWKDIGAGFSPVMDASPISNSQIMITKFSALVIAELLILFVVMLSGITLQIFNGFFELQLLVYVKSLLLSTFPFMLLLTLASFFVHTLVNNKFLGHAIIIGYIVLNMFFNKLGITHNLFKFGTAPLPAFSGMNGFEKFIYPALTWNFYWLMFSLVIFVLAILFIKRGSQLSIKSRLLNFKLNWKHGYASYILVGCFVLFVISGSFIYYNTNVLNDFGSKKSGRIWKVDYEKAYEKFENIAQPRIIDIKLEVDLFPETYSVNSRGQMLLKNKSPEGIDSLHLRLKKGIEIVSLEFSRDVEKVHESIDYEYYIYQFKETLLPGDSLRINFDLSFKEQGFSNWGRPKTIIPNGINIRSEFLPSFGYDKRFVITKKSERKKAGLPEREFEAAELTDSSAFGNIYINKNADRITYEAIVSTSIDQTALTCGTLQKEWTDNNRGYFHYKMEEPIWNFFPFLSARYEVHKDKYKDIDISIYYHKDHDYNIEKMVYAIKQTIAYCEENFSPYQHKEIRIVEFPRYAQYAQSLAGIIPFSEGIGFITDVDEKNDIDLPFYITAHEVAHQWWGHQVCAADVKGKLMMIESMANYTAIMVMEKEYGTANIGKFLKYEQDMYLKSRAMEKKKEVPLYLVDEQSYVAYNKGSVLFYALKDYIGEEKLNRALSSFIDYYNYKEAPYPTSLDFIKHISEEIPEEYNYLVDDMFKNITMFTSKIDSAFIEEMPDQTYKVHIYTNLIKIKASNIDESEEVTPADWIDLGLMIKSSEGKDSLIYSEKVYIDEEEKLITLEIAIKPDKAVIDPLHKLIDRNLLDNKKRIKERG